MTIAAAVIDDDEAVRDSTRVLLESYGHIVRDYASADLFLLDTTTQHDCILVDHHMPGMSGLELIAYLRSIGISTSAVLVTGRVDSTIGQRAAALGITVLNKPVAEDALVQLVENISMQGQTADADRSDQHSCGNASPSREGG